MRFDSEPIPNPDGIFAKLAGKCYFSKLNLCKDYWELEMSTEDKEKTTFAAPNGLFISIECRLVLLIKEPHTLTC